MKRNTIFFIICLLGSVHSLQANHRLFQELSIERGQQRAALEQKLLFVHFSASWCMPSQWMEKNTFSDPTIQQYLQEHYLAIKVDVDLPKGHADRETYQVNTLPTLLVFSASGKLLERIEGIASPAVLLDYLKKYNLPKNTWARQPVISIPEDMPSRRPDFSHLHKPAFQPESAEQVLLHPEPVNTPHLPMPAAETRPTPEPNGASVVQVNQREYGVELAVLQDYGSVIRFVRNLERRFDQKVYIILKQTPQQKSYHVVMGAYPSRREAYELRSHLLDFQIRGSVTALAYAK